MDEKSRSDNSIIVTPEERARIMAARRAPRLHARLKSIVEHVYEHGGYGSVVAEHCDPLSVHGDVGYLDLLADEDGIHAAFDPADTDEDRSSLDWPLDAEDSEIVSDLAAELLGAARHRRLEHVARRAATACEDVDPGLLSCITDDEIVAAFVAAVQSRS